MKGKTIILFLLLASLLLGSCAPATIPGAPDILSVPQATAVMQRSPSAPGFDCHNIADISVEECQSLVALYESTGGDHWKDNSGWLVDRAPCTWYGVSCEDGHVIELQLYYNELAGSLPPEIGNLSHLKSLYLDDNQLSGPLPRELGNLMKLRIARLGAMNSVASRQKCSGWRVWSFSNYGATNWAEKSPLNSEAFRIYKSST